MCEPIKNIGESGLLSDGMREPRNAQIQHVLKSARKYMNKGTNSRKSGNKATLHPSWD